MNLSDIIKNINVVKVYNEINHTIDLFEIDSRKVLEKSLFIGIKGNKVDGNKLYMRAFSKGALCALIDEDNVDDEIVNYIKENNKTIIVVKSSIRALREMAIYKRNLLNIPFVAITGSAGKTSTKDVVHSVLKIKFNTYKTLGNLNSGVGLPLSILDIKDEEIAVLEMGMSNKGDIKYLAEIVKPDVGVITNIGPTHIENFESVEEILYTKLEILEGLKENGPLILNNDNIYLNNWIKENKDKYNIISFGIETESDYRPSNIEITEDVNKFTINENEYITSVPGEAFIYNGIVGAIVGEIFDLSEDEIKEGLSNITLSKDRMNIIKKDGIKYINDTYNANYEAVLAAVSYLEMSKNRKILCLGTMLGYGRIMAKTHRNLGLELIDYDFDILITVGKYTDLYNDELEKSGFPKENLYHFENNEDAIKLINSIKKENDTILIKASNAMKFKEIVEGVTN